MFILEIRQAFLERGIKYPYAQLLKLGIGRDSAQKMLRGEAVQIHFAHLEQLCLLLNCTPQELIKYKSAHPLPENSPLQAWLYKEETPLAETLQALSPAQLQELKALYQQWKEEKGE